MTALLAAARAIHFASLMAIFGGSAYAALLWRAGNWEASLKGTRLVFATASTLAVVSGIVWFCLIAGQMSGNWHGSFDPAVVQLTATQTRFGHVFLARFVGLVVLWLMCVIGMRSRNPVLPVLAGLLLASLGPISHAAANGAHIIGVGAISDATHLLTAGFWLGGLVVLAMFLPRHWAEPVSVLGALRLFSIWGTVAVALLAITGLINAISILPLSAISAHNRYFDLLVVKVAMAITMIGLALVNRWRIAPALQRRGEGAMNHLAISVGFEIALGCSIVAVAGLLGLMAPH